MLIDRESLQRIIIIGNSGSGKSFLASQLADVLKSKIIHFDMHFWEPGGFNTKRPSEVVHQEIKDLSDADKWIMEGVFGDLAITALPRATSLIFLNKKWDECNSALVERGSESSKQLDPVVAEKNFNDLLIWAKAYWDRENSRSLKGHQKIFSEFKGWKLQISDRKTSADLIASLR